MKSKFKKVNNQVKKVESMARVNIKQLGIQFKETKSEKKFKLLFDTLKPSVINYYKKFDNPVQVLEDAFNEAMISIWNDIDKIDVVKYSISTMIYLKVKQNIIRYYKSTGGQFSKYDIDDPIVSNMVISDKNISEDSYTYDLQEDFIKNESINTLWDSIKILLDNETSYNMLHDKYCNQMKTKEIAKKYDTKLQNVLNRIFNAKKKLQLNENLYHEFIK